MEVLGVIWFAATAAAGLAGAAHEVGRRRALLRAWLEAARAAGLEDLSVRSLAGWPRAVEGRRGSLSVRIEAYHDRQGGSIHGGTIGSRIEIRGLATDVGLRPEAVGGFPRLPPTRDIEMGDEAFDDAVVVTGLPAVACALLDAETRRRVRDLFAPRAIVWGGGDVSFESVIWLAHGSLVAKQARRAQAESIASGLGELIRVAEALLPPGELPPRLLANVRDDPEAGVRLRNLMTLVREYPEHPITREAQRLALADADENVQLQAALQLGDEGRPTLLALATSEWAGDACAARAVAELRSELPLPQARMLLARAVRTRRLRTAEACLESLSHHGPEQAGVIGRVLAVEEGALATAAARSLGRVGSAPAVSLLREAEERLSNDSALRRAAREAVAAIQSRLVGAAPGQVSLTVAGEPGRVSLADDEAGRVSLLPAPDGSER